MAAGRGVGRMAAMAVTAWLMAGPGLAQTALDDIRVPDFTDAQIDEMHCIYDSWTDDEVYLIVDNYFDPIDDEIADVDAAFESAGEACAFEYDWEKDQLETAEVIALQAAVTDAVILDMVDAGLKSEDLVFGAWWNLTRDDRAAFLEEGWFGDEAFAARVRSVLLASGVPDTEIMIEDATAVLESSSITAAAMIEWGRLKGL